MGDFFYWDGEQAVGPFRWDDLSNLRREGTINEETLVCKSGDSEYVSYAQMRSLIAPIHLPPRPLPPGLKKVLLAVSLVGGAAVMGVIVTILVGSSGRVNVGPAHRAPSASVATSIELRLDLRHVVTSGGKVILEGDTNLPDGTKLGITLSQGTKPCAQDYEIFVNSGKFRSHAFSDRNDPLEGTFNVELHTCFTPMWQDDPGILEKLARYVGEGISVDPDNVAGPAKVLNITQNLTFKH